MKLGLFTPVFNSLDLDGMLTELKRYPQIELLEIGTGGWPGSAHLPVVALRKDAGRRREYLAKLQDQAVDNADFKSRLQSSTGLSKVYNFYGMVEQVGSVFLEDDDGLLYPPNFADLIVRDPQTDDGDRRRPVGFGARVRVPAVRAGV